MRGVANYCLLILHGKYFVVHHIQGIDVNSPTLVNVFLVECDPSVVVEFVEMLSMMFSFLNIFKRL